MRAILTAFVLACGSIAQDQVVADLPQPAIESVTETFVGFMRPDGTVVCGPLKDYQPKPPTIYVSP